MSKRVEKLRPARQDLVDVFYHFARGGKIQTGRRFLNEVEATLVKIAATPGIGARLDIGDPDLGDLRVSSVTRFKSYLIFYREIPGGIEILRVLHGARDIPEMFQGDAGFDPAVGDEETDDLA